MMLAYAVLVGVLLIAFAMAIVCVVAMWKIFVKAGEHGWAALIPFYNFYVMTKITWGKGWLFLLLLLPIGNLIFGIFTSIKLAKVFGKGGGFACGIIFLSIIFLPILAFGSAEYAGPDPEPNKGVIIASTVVGVIGVILVILQIAAVIALGLYAVSQPAKGQTVTEGILEAQEAAPEEPTAEPDKETDSNAGSTYQASPIEGYDEFETVELTGYRWFTNAVLFKGGENVVEERSATSVRDGIELKAEFTLLAGDETIEQRISAEMENIRKTLESQGGVYTDITTGEVVQGDGIVMQQLFCYVTGADGLPYPCVKILIIEHMEDREILMNSISLDTSKGTEHTERLFEQACELYGAGYSGE